MDMQLVAKTLELLLQRQKAVKKEKTRDPYPHVDITCSKPTSSLRHTLPGMGNFHYKGHSVVTMLCLTTRILHATGRGLAYHHFLHSACHRTGLTFHHSRHSACHRTRVGLPLLQCAKRQGLAHHYFQHSACQRTGTS